MLQRVIYGAIALAGLALLTALHVKAHSWYPEACCSGQDCAPVERVDYVAAAVLGDAVPLPVMVVTTRHGSVVVPRNFPIRQSPDHQMHACMRTSVFDVRMELLCLFLPPML